MLASASSSRPSAAQPMRAQVVPRARAWTTTAASACMARCTSGQVPAAVLPAASVLSAASGCCWQHEAPNCSRPCRLVTAGSLTTGSLRATSIRCRPQDRLRCAALNIHNRELLIADVTLLVSFALWKQIAGIVLSPDFPGWLAPLAFNPLRFMEFVSFTLTLCGTWVSAAALVGGYELRATQDVPTALRTTSTAWLVSMPVAAAQLVLVTALQSKALVGDEAFASSLPLAAHGVGEPFATAAGVLGVMAAWRAFYSVHLDWWSRTSRAEAEKLHETLTMVAVMSVMSLVVIEGLQLATASPLVL